MTQTQELVRQDQTSDIERVLIHGDISKLSSEQKTSYYLQLCKSLGLNPLTKPFEYMTLQGKTILYAKKDATDQLRAIHGVSVFDVVHHSDAENGIYVVTAKGRDNTGREDTGTGAVNIGSLKGDALANAIMKAETKAKRRLTLSICGLGMLDETELETVKGVQVEVQNDGLDEGYVAERIEWIKNCANLDELKTVYSNAYTEAAQRQDKKAMQAYIEAKDARKKEVA